MHFRGHLALGIRLARSGVLAGVSLGIAALSTLAMIVLAFVLSRRTNESLSAVTQTTASVLAWGSGVMLAFASSAHAIRRDRDDGVRALVRSRGGSIHSYMWGRIGGLAALLVIVIVGGTLVTSLVTVALASREALGPASQGAMAALVYALAFSLVVAPVALASLGARSRAGGYLALLSVLVLPELLAGLTKRLVPPSFRELVSIPGALDALRGSLLGHVDIARTGRAVVVLGAVVLLAIAAVRTQVSRVDAEATP